MPRLLDRGERAIIDAWRRDHPHAPEWWIHEHAIDRAMYESVLRRDQKRWRQRKHSKRNPPKQRDAMRYQIA
jgi:hypothetical protein